SREVCHDLEPRLEGRWQELSRGTTRDMECRREQLIRRGPPCAELEEQRLRDIGRLLRPRLALPGERIITKGRRGDAMYFIASGAVEVQLSPAPVRLGTGDFIGEIALVTHQPRTADVVALGYCHLLVLRERDFERLLTANEALRARISDVARQRLGVAPAAL